MSKQDDSGKVTSFERLRSLSRWDKITLPWTTMGNVGEYAAAVELLAHGFEPYLPLPGRGSAHFDMIAYDMVTHELIPISVKTSQGKNGVPQDVSQLREGAVVARIHFTVPNNTNRNVWPVRVRDRKGKSIRIDELLTHLLKNFADVPYFRSEVVAQWSASKGIPKRTWERWLQALCASGDLRKLKRGFYRVSLYESSDIGRAAPDAAVPSQPET